MSDPVMDAIHKAYGECDAIDAEHCPFCIAWLHYEELHAERDQLREALSVTSADADPRYQKYWTNLGRRMAAEEERDRLREALTEARTVIDDQIHAGVLLRATSLQVLTKIDAALAKEAGK